MQMIATTAAQQPIGPYAQAIQANGFIFCSGHAGVDLRSDTVLEHERPGGRLRELSHVRIAIEPASRYSPSIC